MLRARDYKAKAREALNGNWGLAVGTGFAVGVISIVLVYSIEFIMILSGMISLDSLYLYDQMSYISPLGLFLYPVLILLASFVIQAIVVGYYYFNLNLIRGNEFRFDNIFARFSKILKIFGLFFMMGLFIWLWSLLLIIPGIIASFRYVMAPYIMADDPDIGIMEAISKSKEMMKGYKWKYFCLQFSFLGWIFLSIFTLFIGLLWIEPYMQASNAAFYLEVSGQNEKYEYDLNDE